MADQSLLPFWISVLHVLIPSLPLLVLLLQGLRVALLGAFTRLQARSFLEDYDTYTRLHAEQGESSDSARNVTATPANNRNSVILPPDDNGILPVVVPVKSVRRWLVYSTMALVALSYLGDGVVLLVRSLVQQTWESETPFYALGTAVALFGQILIMTWQESKYGLGQFKRVFPIIILTLLFVGETVLLGVVARKVQLDNRRVHTWDGTQNPVTVLRLDAYQIAHLVLQGARVLLLLLALLSFTPLFRRTRFLANEYRAIVDQEPENGNSIVPGASNGYGTFNGNGNGHGTPASQNNSKPSSLRKGKGPAGIEEKPLPSYWQRIKILAPYLWPRKSRALQFVCLVCLSLLIVLRVVNFSTPLAFGRMVDDLAAQRTPWKSIFIWSGLRLMQGGGGISSLNSVLWYPVAQYSEREMSSMTFRHLLNLSLSFQVKKKTGEVLRTLDRGSAVNSLFQVLLFNFLPIIADILIAVTYFYVTFGGALAILVAVIMVTYIVASKVLTDQRIILRKKMNEKDKICRGILSDALANWETIKYFTAEPREHYRYEGAVKDYQVSDYKMTASLQFLNLVQNGITALGLLGGALIAAKTVVDGQRSIGSFAVFVNYLQQLYGPLNALGMIYRAILQNLTDTDNLMKLLAEKQEIVDSPDAEELVDAKGEIELDHVNFSYDGKVTALEDISVKIPPGTSVALVGESGSGKSTLFRLLYRFYDINGGAIRFDGKDIRNITQHSLRRAIGVVPQETVLFNETIRYNIGYGKDDATQQEIEDAAKAARIYEKTLSFPDGWDTVVGERGVRLSGGERQRMGVARTLIKNPAILLLDEATSALDTATEREIQAALKTLAEGRTSIAIAHRLSTITYCDLILVLAEGRIAERGDHKTLISKKGLYYDLWNKQIRAEEEAVNILKEVVDGKDVVKSALAPEPVLDGKPHAHEHK